MTNEQARILLQQLSDGKLDQATGSIGLDAAGLLGQSTRWYDKATQPFVTGGQRALTNLAGKSGVSSAGGLASNLGRFAASPITKGALRSLPAIGAISAIPAAGDVLFGGDSAANKVMDGTLMTIGGILGSVGGPIGSAAGAGMGKSASDGLQWLFGDKKTAEQRKLEEALALLNSGVA